MPRINDHPTGKTAELPNVNGSSQSLSRLAQSQSTAKEAAEKAKVDLVSNHQERLVKLNTALDKAEQRRGEVLDRLSDRMAYLQDDSLFMNDLLRLTQKKLKNGQKPEKQEVSTTALDGLIDAFDAIGDWELPAINSASAVGGALPASY